MMMKYKTRRLLSYRSEADDYGTNRKCVCDVLLIIHSNLGPVLHRFRDNSDLLADNYIFSCPILIARCECLRICGWNYPQYWNP